MTNIVNFTGNNIVGQFEITRGHNFIGKGSVYRRDRQHVLRIRDLDGNILHEATQPQAFGYDAIHQIVNDTLKGHPVAAR